MVAKTIQLPNVRRLFIPDRDYIIETYRFSSSEDAFGYGTNLQNIPKGTED